MTTPDALAYVSGAWVVGVSEDAADPDVSEDEREQCAWERLTGLRWSA